MPSAGAPAAIGSTWTAMPRAASSAAAARPSPSVSLPSLTRTTAPRPPARSIASPALTRPLAMLVPGPTANALSAISSSRSAILRSGPARPKATTSERKVSTCAVAFASAEAVALRSRALAIARTRPSPPWARAMLSETSRSTAT